MALFPDAKMSVYFPEFGVVAGTRANGTLKIEVPKDIPRAERIQLFWRSTAVAGYGQGKDRSVYVKDLFSQPLSVELDHDKPLPAGTHEYPFAVDLPAWLPPPYVGSDCSIRHALEARIDVDWAIDPKVTVVPIVEMAPFETTGQPIATRSPINFHDSLVIDVTLDRDTWVEGEPVMGQIALRGGHSARFDAISVSVTSIATIKMARGDRRRGPGTLMRIPADRLRHGQSVPFGVHPKIPPTFRNGYIDHDVVLRVEVDIPWGWDPAFDFPIVLVPFGSRVHATAPAQGPLGSERLLRLAAAMASATGFSQGRLPNLVEGRVGPVGVTIADGTRDGKVGVDIGFEFPDLELHTTFRAVGVLDAFRKSPLLPPTLASSHLLRTDSKVIAEDALDPFFQAVLGGLQAGSDLRLSDHHLGIRQPLMDDGGNAMTALAQWTRDRAEIIRQAIAALPFNPQCAASAPAWVATASEQNAVLLPHLPAIVGLVVSSRIVGGEQRAIGVELRTRPDGTIHADLDLRSAALPRPAWADLDKGTDLEPLRAVRSVFKQIEVHTAERITLEGATFAPDPRALLSTVETFFWWLLDVRNERRADAPYR
jgi:hypothetical protein